MALDMDETIKAPSAPVTRTLVILVLLAYLTMITLADQVQAFLMFGLIPKVVFDGEYWRLLTSLFLHPNIMHLLNAIFGLWIFGERLQTEMILGSRNFLAVILLVGVLTNLVLCFFAPTSIVIVGMSGIVYGILGAYLGSVIVINRQIEKIKEYQENQLTVAALSGDLPPEVASDVIQARAEKAAQKELPDHLKGRTFANIQTVVSLLLLFVAYGYYYGGGSSSLIITVGGVVLGVLFGWLLTLRRFA